MTLIDILILIVVGTLCSMCVIERICRCIENCVNARTMADISASNPDSPEIIAARRKLKDSIDRWYEAYLRQEAAEKKEEM